MYGNSNGMGGGGGNFNRGGFHQNRGGFQQAPQKVDYNLRETTLKPINFDNAPSFQKDFYKPSDLAVNRQPHEVAALKAKFEITLAGRDSDTCRPIANFNEAGLPDFVMSEIGKQGFTTPTNIQAVTIPALLSGRNIVGIAKTGSGKTLAYILPALIHCKNQQPLKYGDGPLVLVLAPTRELAQQIQVVANDFGSRNNITNVCVFGGAAKNNQIRELNKGCSICIATPGRLIDFLERGVINLRRCTFLCLDEADRMLDMGFEPQIRKILSQIRADRQISMFSATWPREVKNLAEEFLRDYIQINIGSLDLSANHNILQVIDVCEENEKDVKLMKLLLDISQENDQDRKTIIFVETKRRTDEIMRFINRRGYNAVSLHGDKSQNERDFCLTSFRSGKSMILICTDVCARGIDVDDVKYVINYDYPNNSEDYIHRIGRTGRLNNTGTAFTLFTPNNSPKANDLISVLREANQIINPRLVELSKNSYGNKKGNNRGGMNKKFTSDRRTGPSGAPAGGRMMQDRKRKWEGGNDDSDSKRSAPVGNSRFSADSRGYQGKPAGNGYAGGQTSFGSYNREGNTAGGYQLRSYDKTAGSYGQKPPMHSSSATSTPAAGMAMAYQPAYSGYQAMSYAQYPPMSFAFPPPSSSAMPPLPKN